VQAHYIPGTIISFLNIYSFNTYIVSYVIIKARSGVEGTNSVCVVWEVLFPWGLVFGQRTENESMPISRPRLQAEERHWSY
jgi:hypothetical protein